jgi:prepilin-type N-terminal cleavage/methylation domain-containing protein
MRGFTLIEMVVVMAVVGVLAAILFPTIAKHITDSKTTRATNECQVITAAIMMLYKDTGRWPDTNAEPVVANGGPSGRVDRVLTGATTDPVPAAAAPGARTGAVNWGTFGTTKPLYDFLYFNNPDSNTGAASQNEAGQDYPTSGEFAWKGPYIDRQTYVDPWGNQYVISARFFPGGAAAANHRVLILSAGKDALWSSPFSDSVTRLTTPDDSPYGPYNNDGSYVHDDIGVVVSSSN